MEKAALFKALEEIFNEIDVLFHDYGIELLNCEECKPIKNKDLNRIVMLLRETHEVIQENI
jgi:hypothetical protein